MTEVTTVAPDAGGGNAPWAGFVLRRDGIELYRGTHNECLAWLQRNQPCSWHHALKYEGYTIRNTIVGALGAATNRRGGYVPWSLTASEIAKAP